VNRVARPSASVLLALFVALLEMLWVGCAYRTGSMQAGGRGRGERGERDKPMTGELCAQDLESRPHILRSSLSPPSPPRANESPRREPQRERAASLPKAFSRAATSSFASARCADCAASWRRRASSGVSRYTERSRFEPCAGRRTVRCAPRVSGAPSGAGARRATCRGTPARGARAADAHPSRACAEGRERRAASPARPPWPQRSAAQAQASSLGVTGERPFEFSRLAGLNPFTVR
jgi:hypothetical protein